MNAAEVDIVAVEIEGVTAMLMHSIASALDKTDQITKEKASINAKKSKKTEADSERLQYLEYMQSLYLDVAKAGGPLVIGLPSVNIDATLNAGARKVRLGKEFLAGVRTEGEFVPLIFSGPQDPDARYAAGARYVDTRAVRVQSARVMRCRPKFEAGWKLRFRLMVERGVVNTEQVFDALQTAGQLVGIGDFRPRYGRFAVTKFETASRDYLTEAAA